MPSLAEWLIWGAFVTLDVWLYSIGVRPRWIGFITVVLFLAGLAVSEWGRQQLFRLTREHRLRKARDFAAKLGVSEWMPLEPKIYAEFVAALAAISHALMVITENSTVPVGKMLEEAKRLAPLDKTLAYRLNRQSFELRAKAIDQRMRSFRRHVDRFELAATNVSECFNRLAGYAESPHHSISVKPYQARAREYVAFCERDVPTLRNMSDHVDHASRHQSHKLDVVLDRYVPLLRRFLSSYEAVDLSARRILGAP